jgi:hypothetical protein
MFSGGDYEEVGRWLWNFVAAHAKRENARIEALVDMADARGGQSYGARLSLGERSLPPAGEPAIEIAYADAAANRGSLAWCDALAARIRALAREFVRPASAASQPA